MTAEARMWGYLHFDRLAPRVQRDVAATRDAVSTAAQKHWKTGPDDPRVRDAVGTAADLAWKLKIAEAPGLKAAQS